VTVTVPDWRDLLCPCRRAIRNARRWVECRTIPGRMRHWVKTDLEPSTWYDADHRMLHACFSLLCSFVEDEHEGGDAEVEEFAKELEDHPEPWNSPETTARYAACLREVLFLYRWWKVEKPADESLKDDMTHRLFSQPTHDYIKVGEDIFESKLKDMPQGWHSDVDVLRRLEQKIADDEQSMLHRLIDIRPLLWT
jgi:hypothetical protein